MPGSLKRRGKIHASHNSVFLKEIVLEHEIFICRFWISAIIVYWKHRRTAYLRDNPPLEQELH